MGELEHLRGSINPANIIRSAAYDLRFIRNNPTFFDPCGIWLYCGAQGTGKSLSATKTAKSFKHDYPNAIICSNIELRGDFGDVIPFVDPEQLMTLNNGISGVIFLIDEIQVVFNSLESRNIPIPVIAEFAQNRKNRRVILGTSQVYGRVAKPVREQVKYVILCKSFLKYIQFNTVLDPNDTGYTSEDDGHAEGKVLKHCIWFHDPKDYQLYDTYYKVQREKKG